MFPLQIYSLRGLSIFQPYQIRSDLEDTTLWLRFLRSSLDQPSLSASFVLHQSCLEEILTVSEAAFILIFGASCSKIIKGYSISRTVVS